MSVKFFLWTTSFILVFYNSATVIIGGKCQFPVHWSGIWYQHGVKEGIVIDRNRISVKGVCLASNGDKYLIYNEKRKCYRCVVINEKHMNTLQYKESTCQIKESLEVASSYMTGDEMLYSMFRENAMPIDCPISPPYTFTYKVGNIECNHPLSTIDKCLDSTRFVIQHQACLDVHGSESSSEEIQCLSVWKEGSYEYVVGKIMHNPENSKYRCYIFEKQRAFRNSSFDQKSLQTSSNVTYKGAESGDGSCIGLFGPNDGFRTMVMRYSNPKLGCRYPGFMRKKVQWHTLDYRHSFSFSNNNTTLHITNGTRGPNINELRLLTLDCVKMKRLDATSDAIQLITYYISGCRRGYVCLSIYKRNDHIIEIQMGTPSKRDDDACMDNYFDAVRTPYITLITPEPESKECPFFGNFIVNGVNHMEQPVYDAEQFSKTDNFTENTEAYADDMLETFFSEDFENREESSQTSNDIKIKKRNANISSLQNDNDITSDLNNDIDLKIFSILKSSNIQKSKNETVEISKERREKKKCFLSFNKILFGCQSPDTMEFRSDCPLISSDIISVYLCHGSWHRNVSENSTIHYLVTAPLNRSGQRAPGYCFMYRSNENNSIIQFTSSSDTCYRDLTPGIDGVLTFNITPIQIGRCAAFTSRSILHKRSIAAVFIAQAFEYLISKIIYRIER